MVFFFFFLSSFIVNLLIEVKINSFLITYLLEYRLTCLIFLRRRIKPDKLPFEARNTLFLFPPPSNDNLLLSSPPLVSFFFQTNLTISFNDFFSIFGIIASLSGYPTAMIKNGFSFKGRDKTRFRKSILLGV